MLNLQRVDEDDTGFLDLAGRLIAGAALCNGVSDVWTIHIDHWFGERWLVFR